MEIAVALTTGVMVDVVPVVTGAEKVLALSVHQKSADPATMADVSIKSGFC